MGVWVSDWDRTCTTQSGLRSSRTKWAPVNKECVGGEEGWGACLQILGLLLKDFPRPTKYANQRLVCFSFSPVWLIILIINMLISLLNIQSEQEQKQTERGGEISQNDEHHILFARPIILIVSNIILLFF